MEFTSPDNDRWRNERTKRAVKIAVQVAGITQEQAELLILEVIDRSGRLEVVWSMPPSERQMAAVSAAWELCGEPAEFVSHAVGASAIGARK